MARVSGQVVNEGTCGTFGVLVHVFGVVSNSLSRSFRRSTVETQKLDSSARPVEW